ncbi:MAG: dTMP kinase [Candidatus Nezhaarchaeota archaeon]|nr:dTMP kinase [Candidatus Nezhaarchaeota archaeon]
MARESIMAGIYISIDGVDGSGSTTQTRLLSEWLRSKGLNVFETKEPTNGKVGKVIRAYLSEGETAHPAIDALLFAADRVEHSLAIKKYVEGGFIVVSDRSLISSLAYQQAQGLELDWLLSVNRFAVKPDISIILDVDPAESIARKPHPRERFENVDFLRRVRKIFIDMSLRNKWILVDSSRPLEVVASDIRSRVLCELARRGVHLNEKH